MLAFQATRLSVELDGELCTLSCEVEADGDARVFLSLMREPGPGVEVRAWWGDGQRGADEQVRTIAAARCRRTAPDRCALELRFSAPLTDPTRPGPSYTRAEIGFDPTDPWLDREGLALALETLFGPTLALEDGALAG